MNSHRNVIFAFLVSLLLHGIIVISVAGFVMVGSSQLLPVFRHGFSSVTITLVESGQPEPVPVIKPEVKKYIPKSVIAKKEEKIVMQTPVTPVKPPVVKQESPKPVIPIIPEIGETLPDEEFDAAPETAMEDNLNNSGSESIEEMKQLENAGEFSDGDQLDKGIQSFADTESFIDVNPTYPLGARLRGEEGVVVVRVTVSPGGHAEKVEVMKSSGYASLDESAVYALKRARFVAKNGGVIRGGEVTLPFRFKLVN
jgi:periplasmic protein TonB